MEIIPIVIALIWTGNILAISFFESWVKFTADCVTLPIGLSIGKKVFTYLNRIEWVYLLIMLTALYSTIDVDNRLLTYIGIIIGILLIQSFILLPKLNARAKKIINGEQLPSSTLHYYYVPLELIKVVLLIILALQLIQF